MLRVLFPLIALLGLILLVRSVLRLSKVFMADQQEFAATTLIFPLQLAQTGDYEIAVRRPSVTGSIPFDASFSLENEAGQDIAIIPSGNVFAGRKDLRGARIVPVAYFTIETPGAYRLRLLSPQSFRPGDHIIVMPKVGLKGALAVLATVGAGLLCIGGIVLSLLAFRGKI